MNHAGDVDAPENLNWTNWTVLESVGVITNQTVPCLWPMPYDFLWLYHAVGAQCFYAWQASLWNNIQDYMTCILSKDLVYETS